MRQDKFCAVVDVSLRNLEDFVITIVVNTRHLLIDVDGFDERLLSLCVGVVNRAPGRPHEKSAVVAKSLACLGEFAEF